MSNPIVITADSLRAKLPDFGIDVGKPDINILLADDSYALPAKDWIAQEFSEKLGPEVDLWIGRYELEESDCDDFSDLCAVFARRCHRQTLTRPRETAIAFAEFWFTRDNRKGHALNVAICSPDGVAVEAVFYEPQLQEIVNLSRTEIASCEFIRF